MKLNPARCAGHCLPTILSPPTLQQWCINSLPREINLSLSPWQRTSVWCTFVSRSRQLRTRDWLTETTEQQILDCWISSDYTLEEFCIPLLDANRSVGCSWETEGKCKCIKHTWICHKMAPEQRLRTLTDIQRTPHPQCSTIGHPIIQFILKFTRESLYWRTFPICRLVCSTTVFLLMFERRPRQNLSPWLGSVKPSTVMLGWLAWKVSPTRVLSS